MQIVAISSNHLKTKKSLNESILYVSSFFIVSSESLLAFFFPSAVSQKADLYRLHNPVSFALSFWLGPADRHWQEMKGRRENRVSLPLLGRFHFGCFPEATSLVGQPSPKDTALTILQ